MFGFLSRLFNPKKEATTKSPAIPGMPSSAVLINLWATFYYAKILKDTKNSADIPLLDMNGKKLGPYLTPRDWCLAAIEGTVSIGDVTYNYAGKTGSSQTSCSMQSVEKTRWKVSPYRYGIGSRSNPLIPFYSVATDPSVIPFGTKIYIPDAAGVRYELEGQSLVHDGFFRADDVGGAIKGNHIDVFLGHVEGGLGGASKINPFSFIKSTSNGKFQAFLIK